MTQKIIKARPQSRRALYSKGWPRNLRAALYLNSKARRAGNPAFNLGNALEPLSMIYPTTEMSNYG